MKKKYTFSLSTRDWITWFSGVEAVNSKGREVNLIARTLDAWLPMKRINTCYLKSLKLQNILLH